LGDRLAAGVYFFAHGIFNPIAFTLPTNISMSSYAAMSATQI
jgi:hypothetical protein